MWSKSSSKWIVSEKDADHNKKYPHAETQEKCLC